MAENTRVFCHANQLIYRNNYWIKQLLLTLLPGEAGNKKRATAGGETISIVKKSINILPQITSLLPQ